MNDPATRSTRLRDGRVASVALSLWHAMCTVDRATGCVSHSSPLRPMTFINGNLKVAAMISFWFPPADPTWSSGKSSLGWCGPPKSIDAGGRGRSSTDATKLSK